MANSSRILTKNLQKPVTVLMKSPAKSAWAKTFFNAKGAVKAARALTEAGHKVIGMRSAKGFKFGQTVNRLNKNRSTFLGIRL